MKPAGQCRQHQPSVYRIIRFAKDRLPERNCGVSTQNGSRRQVPLNQPDKGRIKLERSNPLDILRRCFVFKSNFQSFCIFPAVGNQQFITHSELLEQLPPPWTLRGQVDEIHHVERCLCSLFAVVGVIDGDAPRAVKLLDQQHPHHGMRQSQV